MNPNNIIDGYRVFKIYHAIKKHFKDPRFNAIENNFIIPMKEDIYTKANCKKICSYIASNYLKVDDIVYFFLSNFRDARTSLFEMVSEDNLIKHKNYLAMLENIEYHLISDCERILILLNRENKSFQDLFVKGKSIPLILELWKQKLISVETVVFFNCYNGFLNELDDSDLTIKKSKQFLLQYSLFFDYSIEDCERILKNLKG